MPASGWAGSRALDINSEPLCNPPSPPPVAIHWLFQSILYIFFLGQFFCLWIITPDEGTHPGRNPDELSNSWYSWAVPTPQHLVHMQVSTSFMWFSHFITHERGGEDDNNNSEASRWITVIHIQLGLLPPLVWDTRSKWVGSSEKCQCWCWRVCNYRVGSWRRHLRWRDIDITQGMPGVMVMMRRQLVGREGEGDGAERLPFGNRFAGRRGSFCSW